MSPLTALTAAGVTRWGVSTGRAYGVPLLSGVRDLGPGKLRTYLAAEGLTTQGPTTARLIVTAHDWAARAGRPLSMSCEVVWPKRDAPEEWRLCEIDLPRRLGLASIRVDFDAGVGSQLFVSELVAQPTRRAEQRPDIFLLLIDTTRADRLMPFDDSVPIGTNLVELAKESVTFRGVRSSSSWTRTAMAGLFTGLSARRHRVYERLDVLGDEPPVLPELLRHAGYATYAWSANPNILPLWGFARGFDVFTDAGAAAWTTKKVDGEALFASVRAGMAERTDGPGFFYVHLMDPHGPYVPPEEIAAEVRRMPQTLATFPGPQSLPANAKEREMYADYLAEIVDLDAAIGRFIDYLKQQGSYENALVLVVSDHGEEFLDHGALYHGKTLYEEVLRVPALMRLPGREHAGTELDGAYSLTDFMPTLLELAGASLPSDLDGRSLVPCIVGKDGACPARPHFSELRLDGRRHSAIVDGRHKLIVLHGIGGRALYDLEQDPAEHRNLSTERPEIAERLEALLDVESSRDSSGWHLRLCGGLTASEVKIRMTGVSDPPIGTDLEHSEDRLSAEATAGSYLLDLTQSPRDAQEERFGRFVTRRVGDVDDVRLPPAAAGAAQPRLEVLTARVVDYVIAASGERGRGKSFDLGDWQERASVRPSRVIDCPPGVVSRAREALPLLLLWYVAPADPVPEGQLDDATTERLRALGYLH